MTREEKFKQLFLIAVKNGFDLEQLPSHFDLWLNDVKSAHLSKIDIIDLFINFGQLRYSINDLILNTNFFDCLFKDFVNEYSVNKDYDGINKIPFWYQTPTGSNSGNLIFDDNASTIFRFQWVLKVEKGTALQWLFNQVEL